jgi:hypothetical protein
MGGTEIPTVDAQASNSTYWTAASSSTGDVISSAKSYIPEQVWNDDVAEGTAASGGGGTSIYETRPTWQTGISVGGVALPSGSYRLVPDISMVASNDNAPLLFCTSDTSAWSTAQKASCNSGFRDAATSDLTVAGGTSFDAPIFSGMLALINQALNATGLGNVNPTLYSLASNTATYASAFHDITVAGNQCLAGTAVCGTGAATTSYAAATGYDEASGLGSIDLSNLLTAWSKTVSGTSLLETLTTVSAATTTPASGASDTVTITVAPVSGSGVPAGNVTLLIDGGTANGGSSATVTLVNGTATYSFSSTVAGAHIIVATYAGSTAFGPSANTLALSIGAVVSSGTFTLSASPSSITVAPGASTSFTLTATPAAGYTGTIDLGYTYAPTTLNDFCASDLNGGIIAITGTTAVSDTITFYTSATTCNSLGLTIYKANPTGKTLFRLSKPNPAHASAHPPTPAPGAPRRNVQLAAAMACLLLTFGFGRRSGRMRGKLLRGSLSLAALALLSLAGFGLTACSNNSAGAAQDTSPGTYVFTLSGNDSANTANTAQTTVTLTVN